MAGEGMCIAKVDEKVVFVEKTAPGDIVDIQITKKKKSYAQAKPIRFHEYADLRVAPYCEHHELCGGCKWQHIDYAAQLVFKQQHVLDCLTRLGGLTIPKVEPIVTANIQTHYRNKLEFTFTNKRWLTTEQIQSQEYIERNGLGFHMPGRFDKIIDINECHLQAAPSNEIRLAIKNYAIEHEFSFYDIHKQVGLLRNLIIRTSTLGKVMVIVQFGEHDEQKITSLMEYLQQNFSQITSLYYIINTKKNDSYQDLPAQWFAGETYLTEMLGNIKYKLGPKSFFQTNTAQAQKLYDIISEMAAIKKHELVFDLYTGIGSIALYLAHQAKQIIGVEYIQEAIDDAMLNAADNKIENVTFIAGDMKDVLPNMQAQYGTPEVVITDPPRAGMHPDVIHTILDLEPNRIVYVSCNPATQARDLSELVTKYEIIKIQPVDMFPHTHHVENVVLLSPRNN